MSIMRRLVLPLTLIVFAGCSSVSAQQGQMSSGADGSPKAQKLSSNQGQPPKNNKQVSKPHTRLAPQSSPLLSAETYAAKHSADLPVSATASSASRAPNSWTGFYLGAGAGVGRQ